MWYKVRSMSSSGKSKWIFICLGDAKRSKDELENILE